MGSNQYTNRIFMHISSFLENKLNRKRHEWRPPPLNFVTEYPAHHFSHRNSCALWAVNLSSIHINSSHETMNTFVFKYVLQRWNYAWKCKTLNLFCLVFTKNVLPKCTRNKSLYLPTINHIECYWIDCEVGAHSKSEDIFYMFKLIRTEYMRQ